MSANAVTTDIPLLDADMNIISALDDEPNAVGGLTAAELKGKFDEGNKAIKEYINERLVPSVSKALGERPAGEGSGGRDGVTFIPFVSNDGVISWSNDGGKENPSPVNIKGPAGRDGQDGVQGEDGVSPIITVTTISGGHRVTIIDANGTKYFDVKDGKDGSGGGTGGGADGEDGFSPIVTISRITGGHRVTIEDLNGPQSFDVMDGKDGQDGSPGKDGQDGVSATHSWTGTVLTITSASGTSSANLVGPQGPAGEDGQDGQDGVSISSVRQTTTSNADGGTNVVTVTLSNGQTATFDVKNGSKGSAGANGNTPVKGTDYWTADDRQQMVSDVLAAMPAWEGGSY